MEMLITEHLTYDSPLFVRNTSKYFKIPGIGETIILKKRFAKVIDVIHDIEVGRCIVRVKFEQ